MLCKSQQKHKHKRHNKKLRIKKILNVIEIPGENPETSIRQLPPHVRCRMVFKDICQKQYYICKRKKLFKNDSESRTNKHSPWKCATFASKTHLFTKPKNVRLRFIHQKPSACFQKPTQICTTIDQQANPAR